VVDGLGAHRFWARQPIPLSTTPSSNTLQSAIMKAGSPNDRAHWYFWSLSKGARPNTPPPYSSFHNTRTWAVYSGNHSWWLCAPLLLLHCSCGLFSPPPIPFAPAENRAPTPVPWHKLIAKDEIACAGNCEGGPLLLCTIQATRSFPEVVLRNKQRLRSSFLVQATVKVHAQTDNVAGVKLPKFEQLDSGSAAKMNLTGLGAGGQQVQVTRKV